jgi:hypothetical protein
MFRVCAILLHQAAINCMTIFFPLGPWPRFRRASVRMLGEPGPQLAPRVSLVLDLRNQQYSGNGRTKSYFRKNNCQKK